MNVFLKQIPNKKSGKTFLSIVKPYKHKESGNVRTKTVQSIGYLEDIRDIDDPVAYYTELARKMTLEEKDRERTATIEYKPSQRMEAGTSTRRNIGYFALSRLYHELGIRRFWAGRQQTVRSDYQLDQIFRMLVFQRILDPGSKKYTFEHRNEYFERYDFDLQHVYRALTNFAHYKDDFLFALHTAVSKQYSRDTSHVYYDVTNYYFEIDETDALRQNGVSKEHRPNPIVQMGLLMDQSGLPISYQLFSGNTNDCLTLRPVIRNIRERYAISRMIVVADKGLNTSNNIAAHILNGDGYIYAQSVRKATQEMQTYVLDEEGYSAWGEDFKIKSRLEPRVIQIEDVHGKKKSFTTEQKQVIFYSRDYDLRAKAERAQAIAKARDIVDHPSRHSLLQDIGCTKYIQHLNIDRQTGEILRDRKRTPVLDTARIAQEERLDGYYALVTSEMDMSDEAIIDTYRGLWQIEESFRITKGDLQARPVYLSDRDHIEAHFLICFVALLLVRCLQLRTDSRFSVGQMIDSLRRASGSLFEEDLYVFDHYDSALEAIGQAVGIDFAAKFHRVKDIRHLAAQVKKQMNGNNQDNTQ